MQVTTDEIQRTQTALFAAHGLDIIKIATLMRSLTIRGFDDATTYELQEVLGSCIAAKLQALGKNTTHLRAAVRALNLAAQAFDTIQAIPDDSDVLAAMLTRWDRIDAIASAMRK